MMEFANLIDESICELELEKRIEVANELDHKNRKDLLANSKAELDKIKQNRDKTTYHTSKIDDSIDAKDAECFNVWLKASEYISHAEQYDPRFVDIPQRMVKIINKKANM